MAGSIGWALISVGAFGLSLAAAYAFGRVD